MWLLLRWLLLWWFAEILVLPGLVVLLVFSAPGLIPVGRLPIPLQVAAKPLLLFPQPLDLLAQFF
jgi:hypothetical protein